MFVFFLEFMPFTVVCGAQTTIAMKHTNEILVKFIK